MKNPLHHAIVAITLLLTVTGCGDAQDGSAQATGDSSPTIMEAPQDLQDAPITASELRKELRANEQASFKKVGGEIVEVTLFNSGVKDISPLKGLNLRSLDLGMCELDDISVIEGMPLKQLILENTTVKDLSPLKGMQLEIVYLQNTKVDDISVLQGMPIKQLNLVGTKVTDLSAIKEMPLEILWVSETPISDLSVVAESSMISLDIRATAVTDLSPLAGMAQLQRLNIVDCDIKDLTPLKDLRLQRLLFTPANVEKGIDAVRGIASLQNIGTDGIDVRAALPTQQFWTVYDDGGFRPQPETAVDESGVDESAVDGPASKETATGSEAPAANSDEQATPDAASTNETPTPGVQDAAEPATKNDSKNNDSESREE